MKQYLPNLNSRETAICQDYPFGRGRCIRRVWVEQAAKGACKGQFRMMFQTTTKQFNEDYNAKIAELGSREAAVKWAVMEFKVQDKPHLWNADKTANYHHLIAPYLDTETQHVEYAVLSAYDGPEKFQRFFEDWIKPDHMPDEGRQLYHALVSVSRRCNQRSWAEHDIMAEHDQKTESLSQSELHEATLGAPMHCPVSE